MRAEVVQSIAVCALLGGCLAAPPPASGEVETADAGVVDGSRPVSVDDAGDPVMSCAVDSELDLAYLNRVGVIGTGAGSQIALADIAVIVNPGPDPLETASFGAAIHTEAGIAASIEISARDGHLALPAGQAHGAVALDYTAQVLSDVDETWTDYAFPALAIDLSIADALDGETGVLVELVVDGYRFEAPITLVPGAHFQADGLGADRITARCGE